mmetsp:Transcript_3142/g.4841  ORF Transcript_3142/g.4841 Transcript_3142/m.4841 type:complete len:343 (-) Transcript_3142:101-1129(-)
MYKIEMRNRDSVVNEVDKNLEIKEDFKDIPGLADVLNKVWPPHMVEPNRRKPATFFFSIVLILYTAYAIASCVMVIRKRMSPSISYFKDTDRTFFKSPYWTICMPQDGTWTKDSISFKLNPSCSLEVVGFVNTGDCKMEETYIFNSQDDYCVVLNINEEISAFFPSININVQVNDPTYFYNWLNYYVTEFEPTDGINWDDVTEPFDFGWVAMGAEYEVKVTKLENRLLNASMGGLKINPIDVMSYSIAPRYDLPRSSSTTDGGWFSSLIVLHIWADPQGVEVLTENDPVDALNLIGSIAGLFSYVTLIFMIVFGASVYKHMKSMEEQKVQEIIKRVKRETQI